MTTSDKTPTPPSDRPVVSTGNWLRPVTAHGDEAALLIRVFGEESTEATKRASVDAAFVIDRSGSMSGNPLRLATHAVDHACGHLKDQDRAAVVTFDNAIEVIHEFAKMTSAAKQAVRLALSQVVPGGSTFLAGGWQAGAEQIAHARPLPDQAARPQRVILLSDGHANVGMSDPGSLSQVVAGLRQRGIMTTTIGVGVGYDHVLMSAMAEAGGGNHFFVADANELKAIFEQELQETLKVVARGTTVTLTVPEGVHAWPQTGFPAHRVGKTWTIEIGDVPAGDVLDIVFVLQLQPGFAEAQYSLGVRVDWTSATDGTIDSEVLALPAIRVGTAEEVAAAPLDPLVAERTAIQRAAVARRQALEHHRAGRYEEATASMDDAMVMFDLAPASDEMIFERRLYRDTKASLAGPMSSEDLKSAYQYDSEARRGRGAKKSRGAGRSSSTKPDGQQ